MFNLQQTPGRTVMVNGKEHLFFSGYSYLGMQHVPEFTSLVKEGMDKFGWLFPSSRISNTQLELFEAFEDSLSKTTGMQRSVCFSSGFLAGRAAVSLLQAEQSHFFSAPSTHPAIDLSNSSIPASDFEEWSRLLVDHIKTLQTNNPVIISFDSVNPLTAKVNDTSFLNEIEERITCLIDHSHGFQLTSPDILQPLPPKSNIEYIISYSLSKACNLIGGAVSCSAERAGQLKATAHYTASTSIAPAFAYAFLHGRHLYEKQKEKLKANIALFNQLTQHRFASDDRLPFFSLPGYADGTLLAKDNIIISSFAYPDPSGKRINRIVLSALHSTEDLEYLAAKLNKLPAPG